MEPGLSVLRRHPHRARRRVGRSCSTGRTRRGGPIAAHRARRARRRHARRSARPGSSSSAWSRTRPATSGSAPPSVPRSSSRRAIWPATRLLGFGSRAEYEAFVRLPGNLSAPSARRALPPRASRRAGAVSARCRRTSANLNDALGRLTGYLGLVGLIALLLGGIGVASAVVVFIRQRLDTIAVLRCLGATAATGARGLRRGGGGDGARAAARSEPRSACSRSAFCPAVLAGLLPVDVRARGVARRGRDGRGGGARRRADLRGHPAARPSGGCRRWPPSAATWSRRAAASTRGARWRGGPGRGHGGAGGACRSAAGARAASSSAASRSRSSCCGVRPGRPFDGRAAGSLRAGPTCGAKAWPTCIARRTRRPRSCSRSASAPFSSAPCSWCSTTCSEPCGSPAVRSVPTWCCSTSRPDQLASLARMLRAGGLSRRRPRADRADADRVAQGSAGHAFARRDTSEADDGPGPGNWAVRREYRSTYRDSLVASERLVAGHWWTPSARVAEISIERDVAHELDVACR